MIGHAFDFYWTEQPYWLETFQLQQIGVVIFFVISGFLISASIHKIRHAELTSKWHSYLTARSVRIYSTLFPALLVIALLDYACTSGFQQDYAVQTGLKAWLANLLNLQNSPLTQWRWYGTGFPLWSLAVEWWLYMLCGFILIKDASRSPLAWLLFLTGLIIVSHNAHAGVAPGIVFSWVAGALIYHTHSRQITSRVAIPLSVLLIGGWHLSVWSQLDALSIAYQPVTGALIGLVFWGILRTLNHQRVDLHNSNGLSQTITVFARLSYSLYLLHFSVLASLFWAYGEISDWLLITIAVLCCNMFAAIFSRLFEWHWKPNFGFYQQSIHRET